MTMKETASQHKEYSLLLLMASLYHSLVAFEHF